MNAIIILGSRNPKGQTAQAAQALADGLTEAGAHCEQIFLPTLLIQRCEQCDDDGWGDCRANGACIIEDDFAELVDKLKAANVAAFVTPVYYGDLSESLRAFLDRLRRIRNHPAGQESINGKIVVGIGVAGGRGGGGPTCMVSLEKVLRHCEFDVVDLIPARRQNLELKKDVLKLTGKWLATMPVST